MWPKKVGSKKRNPTKLTKNQKSYRYRANFHNFTVFGQFPGQKM